jgi:hypothetical protein
MTRYVLRILGGLLAVVGVVQADFAMWFRLESEGELREIEQVDFALGGIFAIAFVLLLGPSRLKAPWAWLLTLTCAAVIWLCVAGFLIWSHEEQHRLRSALWLN